MLRQGLAVDGHQPCAALDTLGDGRRIRLAGLVLVRQRPGTAKGVIFITLEDETGVANLVVWPDQFERFRRIVLNAKLLGVTGRVQRQGRVIHMVAEKLENLTERLASLTANGLIDNWLDKTGFEAAIANGDEVRRPGHDPMAPEDHSAQPSAPKPLSQAQPLRTHPHKLRPDLRPTLRMVSRDFH